MNNTKTCLTADSIQAIFYFLKANYQTEGTEVGKIRYNIMDCETISLSFPNKGNEEPWTATVSLSFNQQSSYLFAWIGTPETDSAGAVCIEPYLALGVSPTVQNSRINFETNEITGETFMPIVCIQKAIQSAIAFVLLPNETTVVGV